MCPQKDALARLILGYGQGRWTGPSRLQHVNLSLASYNMKGLPSCLIPPGLPCLACQAVFSSSSPHVRSDRPTDRLAGLLVGRTHLSGTTVSPVGGDPGVPMSHSCNVLCCFNASKTCDVHYFAMSRPKLVAMY
jgi:hypothetical protein